MEARTGAIRAMVGGRDFSKSEFNRVMGQAAPKSFFTAADYLAWEPAQPGRHEYLDGEVFAMETGAEDRHVTVSMNLAFALRQHLSGSPCRVYE